MMWPNYPGNEFIGELFKTGAEWKIHRLVLRFSKKLCHFTLLFAEHQTNVANSDAFAKSCQINFGSH